VADLEILQAVVPAGQTVSAPVGIGFKTPVALSIPSGYTGGALKFNASPDGGVTWQPLFDATNTAVAITAPAAGSFIALNPTTFAGVNMLQLAVTTASAVSTVIGLAVRTVSF
jgi:hypothetical protein